MSPLVEDAVHHRALRVAEGATTSYSTGCWRTPGTAWQKQQQKLQATLQVRVLEKSQVKVLYQSRMPWRKPMIPHLYVAPLW